MRLFKKKNTNGVKRYYKKVYDKEYQKAVIKGAKMKAVKDAQNRAKARIEGGRVKRGAKYMVKDLIAPKKSKEWYEARRRIKEIWS